MNESKEEKPTIRTYVFAILCIITVIGLIIWGIFFSNNIYVFIITIVICVIFGIIGFFEELYRDSSYYHKKKYAKQAQQKIEPTITEDKRKGLFCPNCGTKAFSKDAQFCPNCGYDFVND